MWTNPVRVDVQPLVMPAQQQEMILEGLNTEGLTLDAVQGKPRGVGHKTETKNAPARPRAVGQNRRTTLAETQRVGAFDLKQVFDDGDAIYAYWKSGEPAHDVRVRGGMVVWCGCEDARFRPKPEGCKHVRLYRQQEEGPGLIAAAAKAAAEFESAWAYHQLGIASDDECSAAFARLEVARAEMRKVVCL